MLGTAAHTVAIYNRPTIQGLIYLYVFRKYSTATEWGQHSIQTCK